MKERKVVERLCIGCWAVLICWFGTTSFGGSYVWLEGEKPDRATFKFDISTVRETLLSDGKLLHLSIPKENAQEALKRPHLLLYQLKVPEDGQYELWARVCFESVRAPLEWRIGQSEWTKIPSSKATTNVMELGFWYEVAWLLLGKPALKAGETTLEIRYPEPGPDGRVLIGLDCIALVRGKFVPEGKLKPGEEYDTEIDREARKNIFDVPIPKGTSRTELKLNGPWQVARYDDPNMDKDPYKPVQKLPEPHQYPLRYMGIDVPSSLLTRLETIFAHRVIYHTRFKVPAELRGRGFKLHFSGTNWIVSVFVNRTLAGTHRGVWIPWDLDISDFVKPSEMNQLHIAVKGPYYAFDTNAMNSTLQTLRNRPIQKKKWTRWLAPIYPSTKGDGNGYDYGIVCPVTLIVTGPIYTDDIFIKPSVQNKRLDADITIRNTTNKAVPIQILCEAVYDRTDEVEKTFKPLRALLPSRSTELVQLSEEWTNPKLWFPVPQPHLYRLRTTIFQNGRPLDISEEPFGFREVTIKNTGIYINGIRRNLWCWVDLHGRPQNPEEFLQQFHKEKNRFMRFSHNRTTSRFLRTREERLEFYDRNGIPGRLCSMIDGMFVSYALGFRARDPKTGKRTFLLNKPLWDSFKSHIEQLTRAYRNHPSIIFYQIENELVYINGMNLYRDFLDTIEQAMAEVVELGRKNDPTRPYTVGGAGDLKGRLEINCPHYPLASLDFYPENAYTIHKYAKKISRYPWLRKKPWVVGESCYAKALDFATYVMGDDAFRSPYYQGLGKAKFLRMLYGGYRYAGVAAFFPWDNLSQYEDSQKIFNDICIVPRKQAHRLLSATPAKLLFKVLNDTFSPRPVSFKWSYLINGKPIAGKELSLKIEPGFGVEQTLEITPPQTDRRLDGVLILKADHPDSEPFTDIRTVPVLPKVTSLKLTTPLLLYDKSGKLEAFLKATSTAYKKIEKLSDLPQKKGLLLVGADTVTPGEARTRHILEFAKSGGKALLLEQTNPLAGAALPVPIKPSNHFGGYAHPQALGTPLFRDLGKEDLIDWAGDHPTYKNAYFKPTAGARSLVECGPRLRHSALLELPCQEGTIVLCQLRVCHKLNTEPSAQILLRNLLEYYSAYQPQRGMLAVYSPDNPLLIQKLRSTGLLFDVVDQPGFALSSGLFKALLINASKKNLLKLLAFKNDALKFVHSGGWIIFNGLVPDAMTCFNKLLDTRHILRPFRIERVTLERRDHPIVATLGNRELTLFSNKFIARWKGLKWISGNTFSYVIDGLDIAPFCQMPDGPKDPFSYKPTFNDRDPYNFVNNLFNSDFWRYIRQMWIPQNGPKPLVFTLRHPDTISTIRIWNNANYWTIKDLDIIFDDRTTNPIHAVLPDSYDMTEIKFPPTRVRRTITLHIRTWRERPTRAGLRLVGIDNIQFLRPNPPDRAIFLDSAGGLVVFPRGKGGFFLNQIKFMKAEPNPENDTKKLTVLSVTLQNLGIASKTSEKP